MALTFERKLPIILFFVFIVLATIGFVFHQNTVSLQEALNWEQHTQKKTLQLDSTLTATIDAESHMRGFLYTGNTSYLELYEREKRSIATQIATLRELSTAHPSQTPEIQRLQSLVSEFLLVTDAKIGRRKQFGAEQAVEEMRIQDTKGVMDRIRGSVEKLKGDELATAQTRRQNLDNNLYWTIWILIVTSVAGVISLASANLMVWSEGRKRSAAELALTEANKGLEQKIDRRTAELKVANEGLTRSAEEREVLLAKEQKARLEAEIANRLRDEFMATVSHELRTPLNSILGWARLIKTGSLDEDRAKKAISTIIKNSETQNRLIEDLLDVARIISGKVQLESEPLKIVYIVSHSVESVQPTAALKAIDIEFVQNRDTDNAIVDGDRDRLIQVFTNLLTNAVKFSSNASTIRVSMIHGEDSVIIDVQDEGIGITPTFLPLVFERFRQDVGSGPEAGGLGLGLAIVRNLVEMHDGSVAVSSEGQNMGAKFTVTLPLSARRQIRMTEESFERLQTNL